MSHAVHWAAISYRSPAGATPTHLSVTWWGDMPLGAHLKELTRLDWVEAPLSFSPEPVAHGDRKELAETLHRRSPAPSCRSSTAPRSSACSTSRRPTGRPAARHARLARAEF